jgi:two-component sensor histidine kinase
MPEPQPPLVGRENEQKSSYAAASDIWRRQQEILRRVALGGHKDSILADVVQLAEEQTGDGMIASILLLSPDGQHLHLGGAPSLPDAYNAAIEGMKIGPSEGSCGTAAFTGEPVYVADIATDPRWADFRDLAHAHGLAACWSIPIRSADGTMLGTFANYYREPREPSQSDKDIIEAVALTASIAIERLRLQEMRNRVEEAKTMVLAELQHRVKNAFSLAQSLISLNVNGASSARDLANKVTEKLRAISSAHDLIVAPASDQERAGQTELETLLKTILAPLRFDDDDHRVLLSGDPHSVPSEWLSKLALVFHELGTNATKYGALSHADGQVDISWRTEEGMLIIDWKERGGPVISPPATTNFGSRLVTSTVKQFAGTIDWDWQSSGVQITISLPAATTPIDPS